MNANLSPQGYPRLSPRPRHIRQEPARLEAAFTRVDLFAVLATSVLLIGVVLPLMANSKPRAEQATCANNLRQIGQAIRSWAADHNNLPSWRVYLSDGGNAPNPGSASKYGAAWDEFYFIRKELGTPKILICPSDNRNVATDWSNLPSGGFKHPNYQDNAVSYFIGLHAFPEDASSFESGDRNLRVSSTGNGCSAGINNADSIFLSDSAVKWTNSIHRQSGNLLLTSGVVLQLSNQGLADALRSQTNMIHNFDPNPVIHLLLP